jgi:hypothetical protein
MLPAGARSSFPKLIIIAIAWLLVATVVNSVAAQEQGGPTTLIITYRCLPSNRAHFRDSVEKTEIKRFEKWKGTNVLGSYRLLFNWYTDANTWDMMAILNFHKYADLAQWKEIERTSPGGLSEETLRWGAPLNTYSADLTWHEIAPGVKDKAEKSVFFVIPYDVVNMEEYKPYVAGYVIPQMKGWIREGVLSSYNLYLNRYYAGTPWDALLVLEYKDLESFGQRESVVAKVRAALSADPKWKALSENKKNIRTEKESALADELALH